MRKNSSNIHVFTAFKAFKFSRASLKDLRDRKDNEISEAKKIIKVMNVFWSGQGKHQKSTAFVGRGCGVSENLASKRRYNILNEIKQATKKFNR